MNSRIFLIKNKDQLNRVTKQLEKMEIPPNGWHMRLTDAKNNRSLEQNRYLWRRVYQPIAEQVSEETGSLVKKEQVHEFLKDRFSPRVIYKFMDSTKSYPKSTTKYTKQEMSDYIEKCHAWGTEHGVWFE